MNYTGRPSISGCRPVLSLYPTHRFCQYLLLIFITFTNSFLFNRAFSTNSRKRLGNNLSVKGSPFGGAGERSETERLYEGEPFLLASPVSFWRNVWYNGFAVHPAYLTGEEVDALAYFLTFLVSVGADVVSHFICKWLDRCEENRKA